MSASSLIAVSLPEPQSTCSPRPSRAMMLSSPEPPLKTSVPPPPNSPSLPEPPSKITGSVTLAPTAATSLPASRSRTTAEMPALGQSTLCRPGSRTHCGPGPRTTPPKRVKRMVVPVSKAAI